MKETDLYLPVKKWLEDRGWDVYAEVTGVGGRADIVGRQGRVTLNIELKLQLSFDLLGQAIDRKNYFNYVYIAIPKRKSGIPRFVKQVLENEKIGIIYIDQIMGHSTAHVYSSARFHRPPYYDRIDWDDLLKPEYKGHTGGDNGSHILTPYKILMCEVRNYLISIRVADLSRTNYGGHRNYGWKSIDDILEHCEADHHYAAPKPSMSHALRTFEKDWCETKKEKGRLYFRAKEGVERVSRFL